MAYNWHMQPGLRPYWIANRATDWILIVDRSSSVRRFGKPDILREIEIHLFGAHMCVVGLRHLRRCLDHLEALVTHFPDETRKLINAFETAYDASSITTARDALEHEEDRVAGRNLGRRGTQYEGDFPNPRVTGRKSYEDRVSMIQVLDEDFELSEVILAALALDQPLRELAQSIWEELGKAE